MRVQRSLPTHNHGETEEVYCIPAFHLYQIFLQGGEATADEKTLILTYRHKNLKLKFCRRQVTTKHTTTYLDCSFRMTIKSSLISM